MTPVTNDVEFLQAMIPHHQEAVDTSALIVTRTQNPQLAQFAQAVMSTQTQEITQMKQWYGQTQGKPYHADGRYAPMMGDTAVLRHETEAADVAYMQGMVAHHQGAIVMAQQIAPVTQNLQVKQLAQAIIATQSKEVNMLNTWLGQSAQKMPTTKMPTEHSTHTAVPKGHDNSDGHHGK